MHTQPLLNPPFPLSPPFPVQTSSPLEFALKTSLSREGFSGPSEWLEWTEQVLPALKVRVNDIFSELSGADPSSEIKIPTGDGSLWIRGSGVREIELPVAKIHLPLIPRTWPTAPTLLRGVQVRRIPTAREQRRALKRSRATRAAAHLARAYDWEEGFQQLEEYLDRERWGQLKSTLEREIQAGLTPVEFELFLALRSFTDSDDRFVMAHYGYRHLRSPLSWALALRLIRRGSADTLLARDELEALLERTLDYTQAQPELLELCSFAERLEWVLDTSEGQDLERWLSREGF